MNTSKSIRRAGLALAAVSLMASGLLAQALAEQPFLGSWKGNITIAGQTLEIRLVFTEGQAKQIAGTFESISQGAAGIKLADIKVEAKTIAFGLDSAMVPGNAAFKGTLQPGGKTISGEFSQAGYTGTFSVEKEMPKK